ncbi:hypothetical protein OVA24_16560 [Luteolibacter sp. SL250]|uniref:hypothetical protein n=1 Tax=Luteolibacter sp. SL250 TaxID=2995170 RepID=UPI00227185B6|nr:hypothetical protein [Luteolibacter sp. SL250]WAC18844.1 hypothetical protein OVA24_16560 [Luteolibacter sp. SL250]
MSSTRIITLTASRIYVGQHTVEVPAWLLNDRFRAFVAHGGATSRLFAERMTFGRLHGTGLAAPLVSDARDTTVPVDFPLTDITDALRADGLNF